MPLTGLPPVSPELYSSDFCERGHYSALAPPALMSLISFAKVSETSSSTLINDSGVVVVSVSSRLG